VLTRLAVVKRIARIVLIGAGLVVLVEAAALAWLKAHENQLVFAVEAGRRNLPATPPADAERITVPAPDGTGLAGLVFRADSGADNGFWVLHLHGNADSAFSATQVRHCQALRRIGFNVLNIDYRGFGPSPGAASEAGMDEDAEAAYQALLGRGIPPNHIVLLGHSLGSGPAVLLATRRPAAALVLFGAFTSIPDAAAERYPYLPVRLAVGIQFNSLSRMADVHIPVVIVHSRADTVIPYSHALTLFAAANEPKRLVSLDFAPNDGFGGHVDALFEHLELLQSALAGLVPAIPPPR
jgi:uncharacterized protein